MPEHEALIASYTHLDRFARADEALHMLKKVASLVKPIMRDRRWSVRELAEFYPDQRNLLGLNVNRGMKICLRLRYPHDRNQFLPIENIVDTMLHELCHIVHGPHNGQFHALWDQLRDEWQGLLFKGYTGEGFLSEGRQLGGRGYLPAHEVQRLASAAATKRKAALQSGNGMGQRLGGGDVARPPRPGRSLRTAAATAADKRNNALEGCGTDKLNDTQIRDISDAATRNGFRTQAEEDEANDLAIAQALWEMAQEDGVANFGTSSVTPSPAERVMMGSRSQAVKSDSAEAASSGRSGYNGVGAQSRPFWICTICTLHNSPNFLCCDACGGERSEAPIPNLATKPRQPQSAVVDLTRSPPKKKQRQDTSRLVKLSRHAPIPPPAPQMPLPPPTWRCNFCSTVMERQWWTCSTCGQMKTDSR